MAEKVYKLFMGEWTEAWYQLSEDERNNIFNRREEAFIKVGGKRINACRSFWSDESCAFFGIEEFPSIEAVQEYSEVLEELQHGRYLTSKTILGTEWKA